MSEIDTYIFIKHVFYIFYSKFSVWLKFIKNYWEILKINMISLETILYSYHNLILLRRILIATTHYFKANNFIRFT